MTILVRTRTTLLANGTARVDSWVLCPERCVTVPVSDCARCGASGGVHELRHSGSMVVDCDLEPGAEDTRAAKLLARPVGALATTEVICAVRELRVDAARRELVGRAIGGLPVVAPDGRLVGMVSPTDLMGAPDELRVGDLMTEKPVSFIEAIPVARAAATMAFEGIHHAPIVDEQGRAVGMLSSLDILRALGEEGRYVVPARTRRQRDLPEE